MKRTVALLLGTGPLVAKTSESARVGDAAIGEPRGAERNRLTIGLVDVAAIGELNNGFRLHVILACVSVAEESELHQLVSESAQAPVPWPGSYCALSGNKVNALVVVATNHG